jgi:glutamate synthase (NADPH/NADH) large chain
MESRAQPPSGHDACGVGFIAHTRGRAGRDIVSHGLSALRRLTHRGADASFGAVDGCGLLTAIPWTWVADAFGDRLAAARTRGLGMLFVHPSDLCRRPKSSARLAPPAPADRLARRSDRPRRRAARAARRHAERAAGDRHSRGAAADAALYRARLRIERIAGCHVRLAIISLSAGPSCTRRCGARRVDRFF